jgi:gamma-glutamylcyclotransferase (GGCT)/AIG2-like uncharacterized protein YtfP
LSDISGASRIELIEDVLLLNDLRSSGADLERQAALEAEFSRHFASHLRLVAYGSLAPGRQHHPLLADLKGAWVKQLYIRGRLQDSGWGAGLGFPGFVWDERESPVEVALFMSSMLPACWGRLDAFEGGDYQRLIVPVYAGHALFTLANIYALRGARGG